MKKIQCQLYLPRQRRNEILKLIQKLVFAVWTKLHSVKFILFCSLWKLKRPEILESQRQPFIWEIRKWHHFLRRFHFVFWRRMNNDVFSLSPRTMKFSKPSLMAYLGLFNKVCFFGIRKHNFPCLLINWWRWLWIFRDCCTGEGKHI